MSATKKEIIRKIADKMEITQTSSKDLFDNFFFVLQEILVEGESFTEYGFGTFYTEEQEERTGFNPKTKKRMVLPRRMKMGFRASDVLKDEVNKE